MLHCLVCCCCLRRCCCCCRRIRADGRCQCCRGAPADVRWPLKVARRSPINGCPLFRAKVRCPDARAEGTAPRGRVFERRHPPRGRVFGAERPPLGDVGTGAVQRTRGFVGRVRPVPEGGREKRLAFIWGQRLMGLGDYGLRRNTAVCFSDGVIPGPLSTDRWNSSGHDRLLKNSGFRMGGQLLSEFVFWLTPGLIFMHCHTLSAQLL